MFVFCVCELGGFMNDVVIVCLRDVNNGSFLVITRILNLYQIP